MFGRKTSVIFVTVFSSGTKRIHFKVQCCARYSRCHQQLVSATRPPSDIEMSPPPPPPSPCAHCVGKRVGQPPTDGFGPTSTFKWHPSRLSQSGLEDETARTWEVCGSSSIDKPKPKRKSPPPSPALAPPRPAPRLLPIAKTAQIVFRGRTRLGPPRLHHVPNAGTSSPRGGEPLQ